MWLFLRGGANTANPGYCPFCQRAKSILSSLGVAVEVLELADMNKQPLVKDPAAIMDYMEKITGARTVPRLFIAGKFVGGCDQVLVGRVVRVWTMFFAFVLNSSLACRFEPFSLLISRHTISGCR